MTRTSNQHKFRIVNGHQEWTGPTKKAAEAARDETLNRLFADWGAEVPVLVIADAKTQGLVFQRPDGFFSYRLVRDGVPGGINSPAGASKAEAERFCRRHLAQDVFKLEVMFGGEYVNVKVDGLSVISVDDLEGRKDHARWVLFQVACAKAKAQGASDVEAHRIGCEAM